MLLTKLTLNDFGVYGGHNEFDLSTTPEKPIILVGGTNGSGKTTLFESVMLCLYGKESFEQKLSKKQYDEKIARSFHRYLGTPRSAQEASIEVEFQFAHQGEITQYKITRMWQNNNGHIDEQLDIQKKKPSDGQFIKLDSVEESEWQTFIEQLLPKGVTKLFFFDGEKIQSIADEGDEDRYIKRSFDVLLGLDLVNQLINDLGLTLLRESKGDSQKVLAELESQQNQKQDLENKLAKNKEKQASLKSQILNIRRDLIIEEEKFKKHGGQFADKREQLTAEKAKLESKLETIKDEIRRLCGDILPFAIIPKQLEELKNEIKSDQKKVQDSFERSILEKNFEDLHSTIKSDKFLPNYDINVKEEIVKQVEELFEKKLESIPEVAKTTFNFSTMDMDDILKLIGEVNESAEKKIESITKSYNIVTNSLELVKVSLDSAPKDDEIGPIFSRLTELNRELGELENELDHLKNLESQQRAEITMLNTKIRKNLTRKYSDKRLAAGLDLGPKIQETLEDYSKLLRNRKIEFLERYILDGLKMLLHKENFIDKVSINPETFEVKLFKGDDDELTKDMLSKGELQMYATAVIWGLAKTSGRPLPFMIDTPLARLDEEHRDNLVENFYPSASHQIIILSTNSEITNPRYEKLRPYISKEFIIEYNNKGKTIPREGYFFGEKGEGVIEVR